ncbi:transposase IS66 [Enterocloster clostridioformis]|uniref:Transposase IS66 n=1 Tax=Enterocloster clostridioformis TaxID=1531 RepID=A0A2X2UCK6_9FIRM|nr:transposase IS66 [Enterocloster clostridioformis]
MQDTAQEYQKQIKELEQQVRLLREQVDFLTRKLYGTKSEKTSALEIEGQMSLFNEMESCAEPDAHEPDLVEVEKYLRKRKCAGQPGKTDKRHSPQQSAPHDR